MQNALAPSDFVRSLAPALRQAASIARALEGRVTNRPKHGVTSAVKAALTIADTAAQEALLTPLLEHFPQVRLEAEEDTPTVKRFARRSDSRGSEAPDAVVVIDPIDGTLRFYLEGAGPYATMIGLAISDQYEAALVALPRQRLCFDAVRGGGANQHTSDGTSQPVSVPDDPGRAVLVSHNLPRPAIEVLKACGYEVLPASGGAISVAPLVPGVRAGLRLARENPEGVSIRGRIGALIAEEAGVLVRSERGAFPANIRQPTQALMVAAATEDLTHLQEALAAARST